MKSPKDVLAQLEEEMEQLRQDVRTKGGWNPHSQSKYKFLRNAILQAERQNSALKGEEYVLETNILTKVAASSELVLTVSNCHSCYLVCGEENFGFCFVFAVYYGVKSEMINDEVIEGHYLFGRGLDVQLSYTVQNSNWINTVKTTQSVHSQYSEELWNSLRHFMFFFRNQMVEVLAAQDPPIHTFNSYRQAVDFAFLHV